jgi:hypothetical protein
LVWHVGVEVRRSKVHGNGLFAKEHIPAGTRIWQFDDGMHVCTPKSLLRLSARTITRALYAGYLHVPSGHFLWYTDGMGFMNHADAGVANVGLDYWPTLSDDHLLALRDIAPGEELREDYRGCLAGGLAPHHWMRPFYLSYCPNHYRFLLGLFAPQTITLPGFGIAAEGCTNLPTVEISVPSITGLGSTAMNPEARQAA